MGAADLLTQRVRVPRLAVAKPIEERALPVIERRINPTSVAVRERSSRGSRGHNEKPLGQALKRSRLRPSRERRSGTRAIRSSSAVLKRASTAATLFRRSAPLGGFEPPAFGLEGLQP